MEYKFNVIKCRFISNDNGSSCKKKKYDDNRSGNLISGKVKNLNISEENGNVVIRGSNGNKITDEHLIAIRDFYDCDTTLAIERDDGIWAFVDVEKETVGEFKYISNDETHTQLDEILYFGNCLLLVQDINLKCCYVDETGHETMGSFDDATEFDDDHSTVSIGNRAYVIDKNGRKLNSKGFFEAYHVYDDVIIERDSEENNSWQLIDTKSGTVIDSNIEDFFKDSSTGIQVFKKGNTYSVYDKKRNRLSEYISVPSCCSKSLVTYLIKELNIDVSSQSPDMYYGNYLLSSCFDVFDMYPIGYLIELEVDEIVVERSHTFNIYDIDKVKQQLIKDYNMKSCHFKKRTRSIGHAHPEPWNDML